MAREAPIKSLSQNINQRSYRALLGPHACATPGEDEFLPEIAGLTLNAALEYASDATLPPNATLCIWSTGTARRSGFKDRALSNSPAIPSDRALRTD